MAVKFPPKPDIKLENAPLDEVVCQIRFPTILKINKEEPSEFQDEIRNQFPQLEVERGFLFLVPGFGSGEASPAEAQTKIYRFRTQDGQFVISLAADFYAVSTTRYTHWEDFAHYLSLASEAILRVYQPPFATRIGLRYINRLTLKNTHSQNLPELLEVLNPDLTAYFRNPEWSDPARMQFYLLLTEDDTQLALRTEQGMDSDKKPFFLLDFDYFQEGQFSLSDLIDRCDRYHEMIYHAFRWCIQDAKLGAFEPVSREK